MKPEYLILRTKNAGDIVINRSYTLIYEAIDKLVSAKRKIFTGIDDNGAKQLFEDIEDQTFGDWDSCTMVMPGDPAYDRLPVIEVK